MAPINPISVPLQSEYVLLAERFFDSKEQEQCGRFYTDRWPAQEKPAREQRLRQFGG